jgi:hypothetical protein
MSLSISHQTIHVLSLGEGNPTWGEWRNCHLEKRTNIVCQLLWRNWHIITCKCAVVILFTEKDSHAILFRTPFGHRRGFAISYRAPTSDVSSIILCGNSHCECISIASGATYYFIQGISALYSWLTCIASYHIHPNYRATKKKFHTSGARA